MSTALIISGPTASGKTALAIKVAQALGTEIISADSRQCYRELDIGVARPSPEELAAVKHHFIASHSIFDEVTAAGFAEYALEKAAGIFRSHSTMVMTGGTGLYIKAFAEGMDELPVVDPEIRSMVIRNYEEQGMEWLQKELQQKDPEFATGREMQNPQRMMRALEVVLSSGRSIRSYQSGNKKERPFSIIKIGLDLPREELYARIDHRVDVMMEKGLLEEARNLYPVRQLNALRTVGYVELFDFMEGLLTLEAAVAKIKQHTRHYAKRQLTWFRRDESIRWFHPQQEEAIFGYLREAGILTG